MKKKIIIGIIITVVLSLTAFGAVYAHQMEAPELENSAVQVRYSSDQYGEVPGENYDEYAFQSEQDCPMIEERNMNNLRIREQDCDCEEDCEERIMNNLRLREQYGPECEYEDEQENQYQQHRYENRHQAREQDDCDCEEYRQFENQNGGNRNRK